MSECAACGHPLVNCPLTSKHLVRCSGWVHEGNMTHRCPVSRYWTPGGPVPGADNEYSVNLESE